MDRRSSTIAERAAAALVIRRAVAPALLDGALDDSLWAAAQNSGTEAWRLFLRVERCAFPLQRLLARHPALLGRHAAARTAIAHAAQQETPRILVARAHLRTAAAVAASRGLRIVVLKGCTLAGTDDAVDLTDVDLLLMRDQAGRFAADLRSRGWQSIEESTETVAESLVSQKMRIEVHHGLGWEPGGEQAIWDRTEPIDAMPPLQRLGPVDHLRHVVEHVALQHPNRRVRLRDLFLIACAARACTSAEIAGAFAESSPDYAERVCHTTLASALGSGSNRQRDLERNVVMGYILELRPPVPYLPREVSEFVEMWAVCMLQGPWEQRQVWAASTRTSLGMSSRPIIRAIERRHATLGRAWRIMARAGYRGATWALARPTASQVRRTVDRAMQSPVLLDT